MIQHNKSSTFKGNTAKSFSIKIHKAKSTKQQSSGIPKSYDVDFQSNGFADISYSKPSN